MEYIPTIGLEIHAQLKTQTKMFCSSKNDANETRANVNICPVCLAHPGALPTINREAVRHVLKVGLALGGRLADYTEFDRKNYFYPDLPKGYQISQYELPLVSGGKLNGVGITRVHLEEDTASSIHDEERGATVIDFNRSGVPLMELVTEPEIHSAQEAGEFARELQLLMKYLGVSDANMEKGEMRVEANVSVQSTVNSEQEKLGTKVEIKNLNSFRSMERAILYEIQRQSKLLEKGEIVVQETRGWDEAKQSTFSQRTKEGSADYRYFPDPDLPSLRLSEMPEYSEEILKLDIPELPWARRGRYRALGLKGEDAEMFVNMPYLGDFFDIVVKGLAQGDRRIMLSANYIANDLAAASLPVHGRMHRDRDVEGRDSENQPRIAIPPQNFASLMAMIVEGTISSAAVKIILPELTTTGVSPIIIAENKGLIQKSTPEELLPIVSRVLKDHNKVVADYRSGKAAALQFLVGQAMKESRGAADPIVLRQLIEKTLISEKP